MQQPIQHLNEISIKVPAPFAGVAALGFTAQYRGQVLFEPLRDIPLIIEGPAAPMRRLAERLSALHDDHDVLGDHTWTDPVQMSDEVIVMAFRDRSLAGRALDDGARSSLDYVLGLVRPVVFPFLQDCALRARLKLSERIEVHIQSPLRREIADLELRIEQIVNPNGDLLLV